MKQKMTEAELKESLLNMSADQLSIWLDDHDDDIHELGVIEGFWVELFMRILELPPEAEGMVWCAYRGEHAWGYEAVFSTLRLWTEAVKPLLDIVDQHNKLKEDLA